MKIFKFFEDWFRMCENDFPFTAVTALILSAVFGAIIGITHNVARGNYPLEDRAYRIKEFSLEKEEAKLYEINNKYTQTFQISKICLRDYSPEANFLVVGKTFDDCTWLKK